MHVFQECDKCWDVSFVKVLPDWVCDPGFGHWFMLIVIGITAMTLVAKCRIDSFRLRGTGSMCHMFLLNVEFSNSCRFRVFQCHFSTVSRFPFPRFQLPQCWHGRTEYWKLLAFLPNIKNVVINFSCWQCLCTLLGPISLLYKQLLQ